jgi:hypothetical protein
LFTRLTMPMRPELMLPAAGTEEISEAAIVVSAVVTGAATHWWLLVARGSWLVALVLVARGSWRLASRGVCLVWLSWLVAARGSARAPGSWPWLFARWLWLWL